MLKHFGTLLLLFHCLTNVFCSYFCFDTDGSLLHEFIGLKAPLSSIWAHSHLTGVAVARDDGGDEGGDPHGVGAGVGVVPVDREV